MIIIIEPSGQVRMIYDDDLVILTKEGQTKIIRASHVEPDFAGNWYADMSPVGGPKLGPFKLRNEALREEVAWLEANGIPSTQT